MSLNKDDKTKISGNLSRNLLNSSLLFWFIPYLSVIIYPIICNWVYNFTDQSIKYVGLIFIFIISLLIILNKNLKSSDIILGMVLIGIAVRMVYALTTSIYTMQHDVEGIDGYGHLGYIISIYNNWKLPEHNIWQFYQPPLHHVISAVWIKYLSIWNIPFDICLESLSVLPAIYSSLSMVVSYKIFRLFKLSDRATMFSMMLVSFHPTFILLSGSVNNDMLSILLILLTYMYAIKWYQTNLTKHIVITALFLSLATLTKISSLMLAFPIGFMFLIKLFNKDKIKTTIELWTQYILFGVISIPLSLSHSIYNYIRLGQPLGYVPLPGDENSPLYVGGYNIIDRFIKPFGKTFFSDTFPNVWENYNLPEYTIKSSLFGEYSFQGKELLGNLLIYLNVILITVSLYAIIRVFIYIIRKNYLSYKIPLLSIYIFWIILLSSHVTFNIKFPFGCTMDFRYIVPTITIGALFIGLMYDLSDLQSKNKLRKISINKIISICILMFSYISTLFYIL